MHELVRIDIEQGSPEWLELRRKHYKSASRTPVVMGISPFSNVDKLFKELKEGIRPYQNHAMKRGNELEPQVREWVNESLGDTFIPKVGLRGEYLASLDGINLEGDTIIEIKVSEHTHRYLLDHGGEVPPHYEAQIQHQLYVFGAERAYLIAYNEAEHDLQISAPIYPRSSFELELEEAWGRFDELLGDYKPVSEVERNDEAWVSVATKLREVKASKKAIEEQEKALQEELLNMANGIKSHGAGVSVFPTTRKSVDYKALLKDHPLNTDPYTKETTTWSVRAS